MSHPPRGEERSPRPSEGAGAYGPVQIWVPDVRSSDFVAEAHRQSALVATAGHAEGDQAFIDAISADLE